MNPVGYILTPSGKAIGMRTYNGSAYFVTDRLGSTVAVIAQDGTKWGQYSYDPYGLPRYTYEAANAPLNQYRYAGGMWDDTVGLARHGVRWYDPTTGRFTGPDPAAIETNPYLYAAGNPCNNTDVTGKVANKLGCGLAAGGIWTGSIGLSVALATGPAGVGAAAVAWWLLGGIGFNGLSIFGGIYGIMEGACL